MNLVYMIFSFIKTFNNVFIYNNELKLFQYNENNDDYYFSKEINV